MSEDLAVKAAEQICGTYYGRDDPSPAFIAARDAIRAVYADQTAELERLRTQSILDAATINGLRLPQTGWKTGLTMEQLEQQVDGLREDAERYRAMRTILMSGDGNFNVDDFTEGFRPMARPADEEQFDAAIDAARGR